MVEIHHQPPPAPPQSAIENLKSSVKRGWIQTVYRHHKGKKLGPYYVRRWKVGKKLHREYVNAKDLERIKAECEGHREKKNKQRECSLWLTNTVANLNYLKRMAKWSEQRKLRHQDIEFISRIEAEGYHISGRPSLRTKITREIKNIDGQWCVVATVFEPDGTPKVFVAPLCTKPYLDQLKKDVISIFENAHPKHAPA